MAPDLEAPVSTAMLRQLQLIGSLELFARPKEEATVAEMDMEEIPTMQPEPID